VTLAELNAMSQEAAERELRRCCGSARWAAALAARRPFPDAKRLYQDADEVWWSLDGGDWLEAFSDHPRIGERAAGWAGDEQSKARGASKATLAKLAKRNREYERKFGHVFLIFASGRSAEEMLDELEQRLPNEPAIELRNAATEQAKITRLRLDKMLSAGSTSASSRT
jgi:2-oxo-4-hydroxy-4-carboxy-5-ureidoimidazoline decarboxylase